MFDKHETHWFETDYLTRVKKYLFDHFGKTFDDLALSAQDIVKGFHDNLHPSEFVEKNRKEWGIHRKPSSIEGTAARIVAV